MKNLLGTDIITRNDALLMLDTAEEMASTQDRHIKKIPVLRGHTVATLFFEDSTRTRLSFETAAKRLSMDVISFSARGSSVSKGESLKDTAQTICAMGAEALIVRHYADGAPYRLAQSGWVDVPILNAGDGKHQHPTQALLDAFTIRRHIHNKENRRAPKNSLLEGVKVAIVGDILHSRVARSDVQLLSLLGAEITLVAPQTLLPLDICHWNCSVEYSFDKALESHFDAIIMLRVQHERMNKGGGGFFPSASEYQNEYGLNSARAGKLGKHTIIMHPGPMNRGLEITASVADSPRSVVTQQVANGVSVRMAALYLLMSQDKDLTL
ncbi:MAG: aspartate carbamoyltransferase catalytic subunit [Actinomycetaceae bacterium]|nr:aspartate carbamoyltransferase catalytic subunit [Actinomycetaceae bacterium]